MWLKKLLIASLCGAITANASALTLNLTLVGPMQFNPFNFKYTIFQAPGESETHGIDGLKPEFVQKWVQHFNQIYGKITPITYMGRVSQITFGYEKNGATVTPKSCQNILLSKISSINIQMSETECKIVKKEDEI